MLCSTANSSKTLCRFAGELSQFWRPWLDLVFGREFGRLGCDCSLWGWWTELRHVARFGFTTVKIFIFLVFHRFWHSTRTFSFAWSQISHSCASREPDFDQPCKRRTISPTSSFTIYVLF